MLIYSIFASIANWAVRQQRYELRHRVTLNQVRRKGPLTDPAARGGGKRSEYKNFVVVSFGLDFVLKEDVVLDSCSEDRPWGFQGGWVSQISRQSAHEGGKFVSPMHAAVFTPRKYFWYSLLLGAESNPGSQCGWKDYVNEKSGIEPATFRLIAQCLNQLHHRVPPLISKRGPYYRVARGSQPTNCIERVHTYIYIYIYIVPTCRSRIIYRLLSAV